MRLREICQVIEQKTRSSIEFIMKRRKVSRKKAIVWIEIAILGLRLFWILISPPQVSVVFRRIIKWKKWYEKPKPTADLPPSVQSKAGVWRIVGRAVTEALCIMGHVLLLLNWCLFRPFFFSNGCCRFNSLHFSHLYSAFHNTALLNSTSQWTEETNKWTYTVR